MDKIFSFLERHWNILAVGFCVVMALCVAAKKVCGCFAEVPVTPFGIYAFLALLSIPCRKIPKIPEKFWYPICLGALALPFFCFLLGSLGFLVGIPLTKWHAIVALLLAVGVLWKLSSDRKVFGVNLLLVIGLWLSCLTLASLSRERNNDPSAYHKPGAILMAEGWNPVWQPDLETFVTNRGWSPEDFRCYLVELFPKGQWTIVAVTYLSTGIIDAGDYVNLLLILVSILLFYHLLERWLGLSGGIALIGAFLLAFNRIALYEVYSGCIDGNLGLCFVLFLLSAIVWLKTGEKKWLPLVLCTAIYGCTLKHTAPVYFGVAGVMLSLPMVWNFFRNQKIALGCTQRSWWGGMGAIFVMVILCGWNPYITNTWNHTSPFYPLHTFDQVNHPAKDILAPWYKWDHFRDATSLQRFIYYHFVLRQKGVFVVIPTGDTHVDINQLKLFSPSDGDFFPVLLLFSLGMLFFVRSWDHWLVVGILLLTIAINPHAWWDRFIPQLFALPVLILMILRQQSRECLPFWAGRWNFAIGFFLAFALLNNSYGFLKEMRRCVASVALESREMAIWQASPRLCTQFCSVQYGTQCHPATHLCFYASFFLDNSGLEKLPVLSPNLIIDWEKEEVFYCTGWVYALPKRHGSRIQTDDEIIVDNSDVELSELPQALATVGKVRWKQLCNAWHK